MTLGIAGVVVLVGWHPGRHARRRAGARGVLAGAVCYALAGVYIKRKLSGVPSFASRARARSPRRRVDAGVAVHHVPGPLTAIVIANVVALALASTALAYLIYFKLIAESAAARTDGDVPDPALRRAVGLPVPR